MLKLGKPAGPQRIVLRPAIGNEGDDFFEPEAFVVMVPITPPMRRRALERTRQLVAETGVESAVELDAMQRADLGDFVSVELIRLGLDAWGGIGDDDGQALDLTPDRETRFRTAMDPERPTGTVDLLLADEDAFKKIEADYVWTDALRRAEKNGLSGSPNGTGKVATPGKDIASKRATRKRKGGAKSAPIANTSCRRKPAKASGSS